MLFNYLKVTIRSMAKNKLFTSINVFGMSVSLACCILLFLYAQSELSFDKHHGNNIYRLTSDISKSDGEVFRTATSSVPISRTIAEEIPEIQNSGRIAGNALFGGKNTLSYEDNSWYVKGGFIADSSIFEILKFDFVRGNSSKPLTHHDAVILEKSWAITIFGEEDPIGKIIAISSTIGTGDFEITAVYDKSAYQSQFEPDYVVSMSNNQWDEYFNVERTNWVGNNLVYTYLQLIDGADPDKVDGLIHEVFLKYGSEQMKAMGLSKEMDLQPIENTHTDTGFMINLPNTTSLTFIYVLVSIGAIILLLACVNYINLSTARAGKRALEVGVRKVMGVTPGKLMGQFLSESIIVVFISLVLSVAIAQLALPIFNQLIGNSVHINYDSLPTLGLYLVIFLIFTGVVAGFYPALYMSSFKPQVVLKGRGKDKVGNNLLRKSLVVLQFVITICLISSILIISKQVDFIKNKELGFESDSKLIIPLSSEEGMNAYQNLKDAFSVHAAVESVSGSNNIPGTHIINDLLVYKDGQTMDDAIHIYNNVVDLEFPQVLGLQLLSGRYFSGYKNDSTTEQILISKTGIELLGITLEDAPGSQVYFDWEGRKFSFEILGVVNDIHQFSLHKTIDPIMYTLGDGTRYGYMTVNADLANIQGLIRDIETDWKSMVSSSPFEYYTLNDHMLQQYNSDFNTFDLIKYFAFMSILISCMGLYAMSLFSAESRFREIGIRKTFGAGTFNIFRMVTRDLSVLIIIAFVLSVPLTWFGMQKWLDGFAYKINPGVELYLIGGLVSLLIAWFTISYQSIKASYINPVDVLKEE